MPDYKMMYKKMFIAAEQAINLLIKAQNECEEIFMEETGHGIDKDSHIKFFSIDDLDFEVEKEAENKDKTENKDRLVDKE